MEVLENEVESTESRERLVANIDKWKMSDIQALRAIYRRENGYISQSDFVERFIIDPYLQVAKDNGLIG